MNPEKAVDYLSRVNWKSLVEWLTAEVILNRPNDPIQFSRDILGLKLAELTTSEYQPENVTGWLRSCYTDASAMVDEHGVIHGKNVEAAPQSLAERCDGLQKKVDGVETFIESCGRIGTLDGASVADKVAKEAADLLKCSTAEVFVYEDNIKAWVIRDSEDNSRRIRIPRGEGIIGATGDNDEIININDAYTDARFDHSSDREAGKRTKTILSVPMKLPDMKTMGVLQSTNKIDGVFTSLDEYIINAVATLSAVALHNENRFRSANASIDKYRTLLGLSGQIVSGAFEAEGGGTLLASVTQRPGTIIGADRASLYLVDAVNKALFNIQEKASIRLSMEQGMIAEVITKSEILNISDAYESPLFNPATDRKTGYRTKAVLCLPIKYGGDAVGALQFINKTQGNGAFTKEDLESMQLFVEVIGQILVVSDLYKDIQGRGKGRMKGPDKSSDAFDPLAT